MSAAAVVFVHGLWMTGHESLLLTARLRRARGYSTQLYHYASMRAPIAHSAAGLRAAMHAIDAPQVHLVGHSLGGIIARSVAAQRPQDVASVITLASPFRGTVVHRTILHAAESVRKQILHEHGPGVLPTCYTGRCTCDFLSSLRRKLPSTVVETAIYTRNDGVADWRYCMTGDCKNDFEVPGTHIGLAFNASAYAIIAKRLAMAQAAK